MVSFSKTVTLSLSAVSADNLSDCSVVIEELTEVIAKLVEKLNLSGPSDMGAAMKELKSSGDPRIDMGKASQIVKELLATK